MAIPDKLLLSDGTSNLLLADGSSVLLLATSTPEPDDDILKYTRVYSVITRRTYEV